MNNCHWFIIGTSRWMTSTIDFGLVTGHWRNCVRLRRKAFDAQSINGWLNCRLCEGDSSREIVSDLILIDELWFVGISSSSMWFGWWSTGTVTWRYWLNNCQIICFVNQFVSEIAPTHLQIQQKINPDPRHHHDHNRCVIVSWHAALLKQSQSIERTITQLSKWLNNKN